eukprot:TRINITY_DN1573_c0_g1_i1.p3 TRINITY_DN1573_c0_g1~~TRINITY_DN1573_c0_g1_i1.p3  ORF type:complete len:139 (-),score=19.72 TRINITY_DN1573_c0_g1_i1:89-505(-)
MEVQKLENNFTIQYKKTKGQLLFSSRDSSTIRRFEVLEDGQIVITGISLEKTALKDRLIPLKKSSLRTLIELVGYQLTPIMDNQKTKIISFLHINLRGALSGPLPQFILNIGSKDTGFISKHINEYLQKKETFMKPKL